MRIGIPKETLHEEKRVALSPAGVDSLVRAGHTVYIETGAGLNSHFTDEEYGSTGANIVYSAEEAFKRAELITKVATLTNEEAEMLQDVRDYDLAKDALTSGEELIPSEVMYAILDGENPIRVWREHRGFSQQQLAEKAGISKPYLSQIETGKRTGTTDVLSSIADALKLGLDDIVSK